MGVRTLRITSGPAAGEWREIDGELVIGREGADLIIDDSELSRRHAALRPVERGVEIEDLGSLNGTFVNGQRISSPLTLTAPGTLKVGGSQATVEVSLPQATRMVGATGDGPDAAQAPPGATVARSVPDPRDVAAQEPVAGPDVTVQRPTAKPDVTAQRPTAKPDVTAQRPTAKPDVTVQRPTPGPDVTVQRPVGAAGPPPGAAPPSAPPSAPAEESGGRSGGPPVPLIAGAVILALIVAAVVLASGGGEKTEKRKLDATLDIAAVTAEDARKSRLSPGPERREWTFAGQVKGSPFGAGNVTVAFTREPTKRPPPKGSKPSGGKPSGKPEPSVLSARVTLRFDNATIKGTERLRSRQVGTSLRFSGTGRLIDGTGKFQGAKGLFDLTGKRPSLDQAIEVIEWRGSVEY